MRRFLIAAMALFCSVAFQNCGPTGDFGASPGGPVQKSVTADELGVSNRVFQLRSVEELNGCPDQDLSDPNFVGLCTAKYREFAPAKDVHIILSNTRLRVFAECGEAVGRISLLEDRSGEVHVEISDWSEDHDCSGQDLKIFSRISRAARLEAGGTLTFAYAGWRMHFSE